MRKIIGRIFRWIGIALLVCIVGILGWRWLYGRNLFVIRHDTQLRPPMEVVWSSDLTREEIAIHYAPQIDQAVNVLLSAGGRGDFITAVDYDGDWACLNNWENLRRGDLGAVVYYSVQATDTHYYVGYYFYHPRDDAEIWLDRHENDLEGIMLCIPRAADGFAAPEMMYTQGHGNVYFYFAGDGSGVEMLAGSNHGGAMALLGDRPHIYICPNGTLYNQGHSVESADHHSVYWSVGGSGVRYYHGGLAETPRSWNGPFAENVCSYALRPLEELWALRNGPYDGTSAFGSYGAFDGDNWGEDRANPPWAWRNKTVYGFGGSFLSDPVWTFNRAVGGLNLSANYADNAFADWQLTFGAASLPATVKAEEVTLHLIRDGWEFGGPDWFNLIPRADGFYDVRLPGGLDTLWVAAPSGGTWRLEVRGADGQSVIGAFAAVTAQSLQ